MGYFKCLDSVLSDISNIPNELEEEFSDFLSFDAEEPEPVVAESSPEPAKS